MSLRYYVTTPLYYVNDEPHIGHAYTTILADIIARYNKLAGKDVRFLTGVDEHGQKIVEAANKAGREPQGYCDTMALRYLEIWKKLSIDYDVFFRTTNPDHKKFVAEVLNKLNDQGDIYSGEYSGWYCTPDERFWTEKDLQEGTCPICARPVESITEKNYFFRMGRYQSWLIEHIESHPGFIEPESRRNEILGFLRQPLGDLCISRPRKRLTWGIPIPFDTEFVTYVWFDALLNYISATRIHEDRNMCPEFWPADIHLIGKDILTTHAVYWPIMLHAAGFEPPKSIFAHGWWLSDKGKMSKSQGKVVRPLDLGDKYGIDALRYVLMREMTPGQDAVFSEEILVKRYNSDLANDLGNLYSRLAKLWNQFDCANIDHKGEMGIYSLEPDLVKDLELLETDVISDVNKFRLNFAVERILQAVRGLNRQLEVWEPWKSGKQNPGALAPALIWMLNNLDFIARLLEPVMPVKMLELRKAINIENGKPNPKQGVSLFPRIEFRQIKDTKEVETQNSDSEIAIDEFARIDLRVAEVIDAKRVEGADKLLQLQIDIGGQKRQIVAGIAMTYTPEMLIGRQIIVVANLKPTKLRGVDSAGMLLAASDGKRHYVIVPDGNTVSGAKVK